LKVQSEVVLAMNDHVARSTTTDRSNDSYTAPKMHAQQKSHLPAETRKDICVYPLGIAFKAEDIQQDSVAPL
jgi:hypothetical protein